MNALIRGNPALPPRAKSPAAAKGKMIAVALCDLLSAEGIARTSISETSEIGRWLTARDETLLQRACTLASHFSVQLGSNRQHAGDRGGYLWWAVRAKAAEMVQAPSPDAHVAALWLIAFPATAAALNSISTYLVYLGGDPGVALEGALGEWALDLVEAEDRGEG